MVVVVITMVEGVVGVTTNDMKMFVEVIPTWTRWYGSSTIQNLLLSDG